MGSFTFFGSGSGGGGGDVSTAEFYTGSHAITPEQVVANDDSTTVRIDLADLTGIDPELWVGHARLGVWIEGADLSDSVAFGLNTPVSVEWSMYFAGVPGGGGGSLGSGSTSEELLWIGAEGTDDPSSSPYVGYVGPTSDFNANLAGLQHNQLFYGGEPAAGNYALWVYNGGSDDITIHKVVLEFVEGVPDLDDAALFGKARYAGLSTWSRDPVAEIVVIPPPGWTPSPDYGELIALKTTGGLSIGAVAGGFGVSINGREAMNGVGTLLHMYSGQGVDARYGGVVVEEVTDEDGAPFGDRDDQYAFSALVRTDPGSLADSSHWRSFIAFMSGRTLIQPDEDVVSLTVTGSAEHDQTVDVTQWRDAPVRAGQTSNIVAAVKKGGHFSTRAHAAPADGDIATGEVTFWFDQTPGSAKLMIKGKNSSGTVVSGSVNLT